ncbi:MAG: VCBS repeat-containing protein [Cyclobacteriaceae bacterium]
MRKYVWWIPLFLWSCQGFNEGKNQLFTSLSGDDTGISFTNELELHEDFDVFRYRNYYNGAGVAIGDINNDGLADIYLTSNMGSNKLFLNKGNFQFEDVTKKAGVGGEKIWSTGVSMVDINGDGLLDIYVCNSGDVEGGKRENELFINKGDLKFSEEAAVYGLDDKGFSTHAVFFDYDQDGDMDAYVLNNSFRPVSTLGYENIRHVRDSTGGDKLYRNDNNKFVDVSEEAGIYGSVIGFGLGVTITDANQDGWLDIYVSNDFFERDYLYINQADGTFKDELPERMGHISHFSMGADAADLNNDGFPEIFVTDMMPESDYRLKTMTHFESYDVHQVKRANDYYEQYMRNTLQLNMGDGSFKEVGQMAGVHASDWSWGAVIADFDNDLNKEIFVSNGVYKDVTNQDFIAYIGSDEEILKAMRNESIDFKQLVDKMPSNRLSNYLFKKDSSKFTYHNRSEEWGLGEPSFSNGAAYGDLDNDGDLDLVVSNVNQELFVYRNNIDKQANKNHLRLSFRGPEKNYYGIGARVHAFVGGNQIMQENIPIKGFQSSMDYQMVMGLDTLKKIDSLLVYWGYDNKVQRLYDVEANQQIQLDIKDAQPEQPGQEEKKTAWFSRQLELMEPAYRHQEDRHSDFDYERLIYHMLSKEGPALSVKDINQDGLDDFYIGGASGQAGSLYLQTKEGKFKKAEQPAFEADAMYEDVDALFFDADQDGDLDLYVVSGGNHLREASRQYQDRLYLLEGYKGGTPVYRRAEKALPQNYEMGSCVRSADYDGDGDLDLFVGTRAVPQKYGIPATSYIYENRGDGTFVDATARVSPRLSSIGMVTDAQWVDFDNDDDLDLVVVGDWMPIMLFKNNGANLERLNNVPGLTGSEGWWKSLEVSDVNQDGEMDFIVGNWGRNTMFEASEEKPLSLYVSDFDDNRTLDHVYAYYEGDSLYPMALRHDMLAQLNYLKKEYQYYEDYAGSSVYKILGKDKLEKALQNKVHRLESVVVINNGDGSYKVTDLPAEVQYSPVYSITAEDLDQDGMAEIIMGGNFSGVKPEEGRYDANTGLILKMDKNGNSLVPYKESGLRIRGEARKMAVARAAGDKKVLIVAKNNDNPEFYVYSK